jgi:hypothetical protein
MSQNLCISVNVMRDFIQESCLMDFENLYGYVQTPSSSKHHIRVYISW